MSHFRADKAVMLSSPLRHAVRLVRSAAHRANARHEWRRRRGGEPPLPPGPIARVLVVCHGNICRSPFAAVLLESCAPALDVRSRGFAAGEGDPADPTATAVARRFDVALDAHRARRLTPEDVAWADLVLGMEGHHGARLRREHPAGAARVLLLGDFLDAPPYTLPDPWGETDEVFASVFSRIESATKRLAARIAEQAR
jgi:protein-tyrosine phosphatase